MAGNSMRSSNAIVILFMLLACLSHASTEIYFSPRGGCEAMIVRSIEGSKKSIDAAVYSLNNPRIAQALIRAQKRGVKIRLLLDRTQAAGRSNKELIRQLLAAGIDLRLHSKHRIEHNKFGIYDGLKVSTGSFNWTAPAEEKNSENCVNIDETGVVESFAKHFDARLWAGNSKEKSILAIQKLLQTSRDLASPPQPSP